MNDIKKAVLVFQLKRPPFTSKCVFAEDEVPGKMYKHVATIDPAIWIERLLNQDNGSNKIIEELYE